MAIETERKFLLDPEAYTHFLENLTGERITQGYLCESTQAVTRVRTIGTTKAVLTVKSRHPGISRLEFEYDIPYKDAVEMLDMCEHTITKVRYEDGLWVVDRFLGELEGLFMAEVEGSIDQVVDNVIIPIWIGKEVSNDERYSNHSLAVNGLPSDYIK